MSRIGRKPIPIPKGVTVTRQDETVVVKGPKGSLSFGILPDIDVRIESDAIHVTRANDQKPVRAAHGMTRAMLNNMVVGVSAGFEKNLEIVGVGYRAQMQGKNLILQLGYSHPVEYAPPAGIELASDAPNKVAVRGIDRQAVGQVAAIIRGFRPPEPYKGKGIRYVGETIIRKAGKAGSK
jgi:large subunit ribosomal protein L6